MRFLLDTNAVIALLNDTSSKLARRIRQENASEVGSRRLWRTNLFYGTFRSRRTEHNLAVVEALRFPVLEFDKEDARQAGAIRAELATRGTPIGPYDVLIAGQAMVRNLVLVSRNEAEFRRVPGLTVEDWEA